MDTRFCLHPVVLPSKIVPCGKCPVCRMKYRKQMALRIYMEKCLDKPKYSYFLTLTYNDENVPKIGDRFCFRKEDTTRFLDSLRHRLRSYSLSFRYFLTCEYGEEGYRSHYHLVCLLYGSGDFPSFYGKHAFNRICQELWPFGFTYDGTLTPYSILYCTSYALKDDEFLERDWKDFPEGKPFRLFSLRPGLGLSDNAISWWSNYISNGGDTRTALSVKLQKGSLSSGIPLGVKRRIKDYYEDLYEELKSANLRFLQDSSDCLAENAKKFGPSHVYGNTSDPSNDPWSVPFNSTPDREIKAFRKALRELGKSKRNPLI